MNQVFVTVAPSETGAGASFGGSIPRSFLCRPQGDGYNCFSSSGSPHSDSDRRLRPEPIPQLSRPFWRSKGFCRRSSTSTPNASFGARCAIRSTILPRNSSAIIGPDPVKFGRPCKASARDSLSIPAGYIVTNQHVVERAADLKIEVITNDGKSFKATLHHGRRRRTSLSSRSTATNRSPSSDLHNISPNLLGQTVIVVGNALGYGSSISRGVLSGMKRDITIDNIEYQESASNGRGDQSGQQRRPVDRSLRAAGRHQLGQDGLHAAGYPDAGPWLCHSGRRRAGKCRAVQKNRRETTALEAGRNR